MNFQPAVDEALKDVEYFTNRFGAFHCKLYINTYHRSPITKSVVLVVSPSPNEQKVLIRHYYVDENNQAYSVDRRFA